MPNHVLLNSVEHKDTKIITKRSATYGDNIWYTPTFIQEFRSIQAHYPILLEKNADTDDFSIVAMFGFQPRENLFLSEQGWDASYIPVSVQRLPFLIGYQNTNTDGINKAQRVITLDMDSPRVSSDEGEDLFLEFGGNSEYLEKMANMLEALHQGLEDNKEFILALKSLDLLEPVTLDIELVDGSKNQMIGFHTVNEDKLKELGDDQIINLHKAGYLQAIYLIIASQSHFRDLVDKKNLQKIQQQQQQ